MQKLIDLKVTSLWDGDTNARIIRLMVTTAEESEIKELPGNQIEVQGTAMNEHFVAVKMLDGVDKVAQALRNLADYLHKPIV